MNCVLAYCAIVAASVACFAGSINGGFVLDDNFAVKNNPDIRPDTPIQHLFQHGENCSLQKSAHTPLIDSCLEQISGEIT